MEDRWNALVPYPFEEVKHAATGPLSGLRLAVKDLFDVAGYPTSSGNPVLLAASGIRTQTAPLVRTLLDAGARFVGKAHTEELAYSLIGDNLHFGMPVNPRHPDRIPGGLSSGSAVAVAAGLADIGLGTDTSGSIRLPAAVNSIVGWRPTHGLLNTAGLRPLAPGFDTPGFLTARLEPMATVMTAVGLPPAATPPSTILLADDVLQSVDPVIAEGVAQAVQSAGLPVRQIATLASASLADLASAFVTILQKEAWESNKTFFERHQASIAPDIAARLFAGARLDAADVKQARALRSTFRDEVDRLLSDGALLALPTLAAPPPLRDAGASELASFRSQCIRLLCPAGLGCYPQLAFSVQTGSLEFSLSLLGAMHADRSLVDIAHRMTSS